MKVTKHIYLDSKLAEKLVEEAKKPDKTQIGIIEYALRAYFEGRITEPKKDK